MLNYKPIFLAILQLCLFSIVMSALFKPELYDKPVIVAFFTSIGLLGVCFVALAFGHDAKRKRYYRNQLIK